MSASSEEVLVDQKCKACGKAGCAAGLAEGELCIQDASGWTVSCFHRTLQEIVQRNLEQEQAAPGSPLFPRPLVAYHYTSEQAARSILAGNKGLQLSEGDVGGGGGGLFFSEMSPVDDEDLTSDKTYSTVFEQFKARQLRRNYGKDLKESHSSNCDVVFVCHVLDVLTARDPNRKSAILIPKATFDYLGWEHFPFKNIKYAFRLSSPPPS